MCDQLLSGRMEIINLVSFQHPVPHELVLSGSESEVTCSYHVAISIERHSVPCPPVSLALTVQVGMVACLRRIAGTRNGVPKLDLFQRGLGRGIRGVAPKHFTAGRYLGFDVGHLFRQAGLGFIQFPRLPNR